MKEIVFYKTQSGRSPIEEFIDTLSSKEAQKVLWVLKLVEEEKNISTKFYKFLSNSDGIIEIRAQHGNNNFRMLGFEHNRKLIVLTNGFRKKDQKVPRKEINLALERKKEYLNNE